MAEYLASIYGTEKDKVNCSFYFKIGACRHGERCSRKHVKPTFSQTILIANMYKNPAHEQLYTMPPEQLQEDFDMFYEDVFTELASFGEVEEMIVCDNIGDHLVGNVYCQFRYEEAAGKAVESLNNRFYVDHCMRSCPQSLKRELMDAQRASIREKEREERHRRREERGEEDEDYHRSRRSSSRRRDDDRYRDSDRHRRHRYDEY
ncbi:splicing factor u2af subunit [Lichtheimia corymbifera JMRC:FSU:9682]|uniref:Splicing factor u2af subunit n=1 Tax=Lichtheimia corymbifera JMRC:FSU:9682 TaxID=1263082 RepID=A0A068RXF3_9FUNG|nr:splicing factor u2af subunit [Lichtheimia corymbifera JMRC:FSU:9682]